MRPTSLFLANLALPLATLAAPLVDLSLDSLIFARAATQNCNLAATPQPKSGLTPPAAGNQLALIALGKGTQNYTCATATDTPKAIGATAELFNASCAVAGGASLGQISEDGEAVGAHFFADSTTPEFDISGLGKTDTKKAQSVPAPSAADVPWLRLESTTGTTGSVKEVYRLLTKGGVAPKTCAGTKAGETIKVPYEAEYWFYTSKGAAAKGVAPAAKGAAPAAKGAAPAAKGAAPAAKGGEPTVNPARLSGGKN